jgi:hypothetical protein
MRKSHVYADVLRQTCCRFVCHPSGLLSARVYAESRFSSLVAAASPARTRPALPYPTILTGSSHPEGHSLVERIGPVALISHKTSVFLMQSRMGFLDKCPLVIRISMVDDVHFSSISTTLHFGIDHDHQGLFSSDWRAGSWLLPACWSELAVLTSWWLPHMGKPDEAASAVLC